jgi:hypothetical protein
VDTLPDFVENLESEGVQITEQIDTDLSMDDDGDTIDITPNRPLTTEV